MYRARLVAKGYDQIAGVDFQYNYAPVIHDVSMRSLLMIWLTKDYHAELIDIKTAFLHGELEEELFITIPEGYDIFCDEESINMNDGEFLQLSKTLYGLVQAARSWWKKFTDVLRDDFDFVPYENNNCLLKREKNGKSIYVGLYVDDCLAVGDKDFIDETMKEIKKKFNMIIWGMH